MNTGRTIFSQVMDYLPLRRFKTCVDRYKGDKSIKTLTCLDQLYYMAFAQPTYRESLRDLITCLQAVKPMLYHMHAAQQPKAPWRMPIANAVGASTPILPLL
jgi:hypothetical protein